MKQGTKVKIRGFYDTAVSSEMHTQNDHKSNCYALFHWNIIRHHDGLLTSDNGYRSLSLV